MHVSFIGTQPRGPWKGSFSVWSVGLLASTHNATEITRAIAQITCAIVMIKVLKFVFDPQYEYSKGILPHCSDQDSLELSCNNIKPAACTEWTYFLCMNLTQKKPKTFFQILSFSELLL